MSKRSRTGGVALPGTSGEKRALYALAVSQPVATAAARTGLCHLPDDEALPYGCSLCVAPCREPSGRPGSAVFVLDHVRRVAFEVRPRSSAQPSRASLVQPVVVQRIDQHVEARESQVRDGHTTLSSDAKPSSASVAVPPPPTPSPPPPPPAPTHPPRSASRDSTPPMFYEDVQDPTVCAPPVQAPQQRQPQPQPQMPAGAASTAAPLDVQMPVDLLEKHRNALLFCHLCQVYIPPHVVNLESHLNTRHIHQRVQDDLIAEAVKTGTLVDRVSGRVLSVRELANQLPKEAQRPPSLMVSEKNYEAVPTFIHPRSVITEQARTQDPALHAFWEAGLDVVHPLCVLCDEPVSIQMLAAHKKKPQHRERQKAEAAATGTHPGHYTRSQ